MTSAKDYVKQYFPDAYLEKEEIDCWIWATYQGNACIIGDGVSPEEAWEDAQHLIAELPEDQKPKIKQIEP